MTNLIKVQWVGGPDDGKFITIEDTVRSIKVVKPVNPNFFATEEFDPTEALSTNYTTVPIKLTKHGYRVYWPY